jgi:hypothetical protein
MYNMKKIILFLALIIFIGCSLDTFKSENLASWSINLDIPLFKTDYTVGEMLKDYDELGIEPYGDDGDSIYVFNALTPHNVNADDYVLDKTGTSKTPILVPVASYSLDIPTLPEELNGINFVDVDLTLEINLDDFNINLADSIIVNRIELIAINDKDEIANATITNQNVLIDGILIVDDPEELINIRPTSVAVAGLITVYPSVEVGLQEFGDIVINSKLHAPLILEITKTATFSTPPEKVNIDIDNELIESLKIFAEIDNQMEIGGKLQVIVTPDTMNFEQNSLIIPDTLLTFQLIPEHSQVETIELGQDKFDLFADSTYMKILINIIGNADSTRFFTNDSIKVLLYSSAEVLIDPQNMGDEE